MSGDTEGDTQQHRVEPGSYLRGMDDVHVGQRAVVVEDVVPGAHLVDEGARESLASGWPLVLPIAEVRAI